MWVKSSHTECLCACVQFGVVYHRNLIPEMGPSGWWYSVLDPGNVCVLTEKAFSSLLCVVTRKKMSAKRGSNNRSDKRRRRGRGDEEEEPRS